MCRLMTSCVRGNIVVTEVWANCPVHGVMLTSILVTAMLEHNQRGLGEEIDGTGV